MFNEVSTRFEGLAHLDDMEYCDQVVVSQSDGPLCAVFLDKRHYTTIVYMYIPF